MPLRFFCPRLVKQLKFTQLQSPQLSGCGLDYKGEALHRRLPCSACIESFSETHYDLPSPSGRPASEQVDSYHIVQDIKTSECMKDGEGPQGLRTNCIICLKRAKKQRIRHSTHTLNLIHEQQLSRLESTSLRSTTSHHCCSGAPIRHWYRLCDSLAQSPWQ